MVTVQGVITLYSGNCEAISIGGLKVGLSPGQTAGIIIGSIIAFLLVVGVIAGLVWCCCCQLKR